MMSEGCLWNLVYQEWWSFSWAFVVLNEDSHSVSPEKFFQPAIRTVNKGEDQCDGDSAYRPTRIWSATGSYIWIWINPSFDRPYLLNITLPHHSRPNLRIILLLSGAKTVSLEMKILKSLAKGNPFPGTVSMRKLMHPFGNIWVISRSSAWIGEPWSMSAIVLVQQVSGDNAPVG